MHTFGVILVIYGLICVIVIATRLPLAYNSAKVKAMMKMMGKKGFDIFFLVWTALVLGAGVLIIMLNQ
jgi:hypothetical protein